jgi:hypothetical protein
MVKGLGKIYKTIFVFTALMIIGIYSMLYAFENSSSFILIFGFICLGIGIGIAIELFHSK